MEQTVSRLLLSLCVFVVLVASCGKGSDAEATSEFNIYNQSGATISAMSIEGEQGTSSMRVFSNSDWTSSSDASWLTVIPASGKSGAAQLSISYGQNVSGSSRVGKLIFKAGSLTKTLTVTQPVSGTITTEVPKADLLDVVFANDGTAKDVSESKSPVDMVSGSTMVNYFNDLYGMYAVHFNHGLGEAATNGYFKVDYSTNTKIQKGLADGHSLEVLFKIDQKSDGSKEAKMFSSMNSGGTGFLISSASKGTQLTFLPNVSTTGSSNWVWCGSGINPEPGRYYHAVGVWDKTIGKAYIYVDGELKGTADASGNFVPASGTASQWFGIGVDSDASTGQSAWQGDVVIARVYDAALSAKQVEALYSKVKKEQNGQVISISSLSYLSPCQIAKDYYYYIYGYGFAAGDKVRLESLSNADTRLDCTTTLTTGGVKMKIPSGIATDTYRMVLVRGTNQYPLGSTSMKVVSSPVNPGDTKVVAHRGYHTTGSAENSVGALAKAQTLGAYASETDVWITTDGVVMVNHNASYPTDPNSLRIDSSTYDQLKGITLSDGEKVPRFIDFLNQLKKDTKMKLVIEIKTQGSREKNNRCVDSTMALVSRYGLKDQVMYIAFDYTNCLRVVAAQPAADVEYLNGDKTPSEVKADGLKGIDYYYSNFVKNPTWISDAQKIGVDVNVWTVDDSATMLDYIGQGVTYITTNKPDVLKGLVSKPFVSKN
jgi:glycerophosphoryl diester phosphodiesterase